MALDWKKAFDSVHVEALPDALRRMGVSPSYAALIQSMMTARNFFVDDARAPAHKDQVSLKAVP